MDWQNPFGRDTGEPLGDGPATEAAGVGQRDDPDEALTAPEAGGRRLPLGWPDDVPEPQDESSVATSEAVPAVGTSDENEPDWWGLVTDEDLNYLTSPRQQPAPCWFCGGRLRHSQACREQMESWLPTMPFGRHKGERIDTLPVEYCRFLVTKNIRPRETEAVQAIEARAGMRYSDEATRLAKRPVDRAKVRPWAAGWARYHRGGPLPDGVTPGERDERRPAVAILFESTVQRMGGST